MHVDFAAVLASLNRLRDGVRQIQARRGAVGMVKFTLFDDVQHFVRLIDPTFPFPGDDGAPRRFCLEELFEILQLDQQQQLALSALFVTAMQFDEQFREQYEERERAGKTNASHSEAPAMNDDECFRIGAIGFEQPISPCLTFNDGRLELDQEAAIASLDFATDFTSRLVGDREETERRRDNCWFDEDPPPDSRFRYGPIEGQLKQIEGWIRGGTQPTLRAHNGTSFWFIRKVTGRRFAVWLDSQERFAAANSLRLTEQ